jgi:hypothetical protein
MKRRGLYVLVFLVITTPLLVYNVIIPGENLSPSGCRALFADLKVTPAGFAYVAGAPWFYLTQLVLKPGMTATITLDYVGSDNNLTQLFMQGEFGQAGGVALPFFLQSGSSSQLTANELGVNFTQSSLTFPSIHELVVTWKVSATTSTRQGEYGMYFPAWCGTGYYLTIGSLPNVAPTPGVLAPDALILFDMGLGLLGDLFLFLAFRISDARTHENYADDASP